MASIANDKAMLDELINGSGDMHSLTAKIVFKEIPRDTPLSEIKVKFKELRDKAKGYEFLINYGGDDNTMVQNYGIKKSVAKNIYDAYMEGFSGLHQYQEFRRKDVLEKGYILLNKITGHKVFISDWEELCEINKELNTDEAKYLLTAKTDNYYKSKMLYLRKKLSDAMKRSINYTIQGAGALCFKLSAIKLFNWIRKNNLLFIVKYCVPVHDRHACRG